MSDDTTLQAHAVRLMVLKDRAARAKRAYDTATQQAYDDFAAARNKGIKQVTGRLPDGSEAGLFSLIAGGITVDTDEDLLLSIIAAGSPADLEDHIADAAWTDERVIKLVADHFPELVEKRIKPAARAELQAQIEEKDGCIADPMTGELEKVATITRHDANGQFQFRPGKRFEHMITAAIEAGLITADGAIKDGETAPGTVAAGGEPGE